MRWIIALLAAGACVALGYLAAGRLAARENLLNAWEEALMRMETALSRVPDGLPALLRAGAGDQVSALNELAEAIERSPAGEPRALVESLSWDPLLTGPEKDALAQCLISLFSPLPQRQARALSYAREQFSLFRRAGREAREKSGKLYGGLGWMAGAALFILFC